MKLNYKKTILVGMAFLIICMFWQVYDTVLARVLVNSFGLNQTWSGLVLAIDNIVAIFLIPVFGIISDKTKSKWGRRTPYIVIGTVVSAVVFLFVGLFTSLQDNKIKEAEINPVYTLEVYETQASALENGFEITDNGVTYVLKSEVDGNLYKEVEGKMGFIDFCEKIFKRTESQLEADTAGFEKLDEGEKVYSFNDGTSTKYFLSKEVACDQRSFLAQEVRKNNVGYFIGFMAILFVVLISMAAFRSPAVSLMPDVTPKPLRSKANAVINLTGTIGGIIALLFLMITDSDFGNHIWSFVVLSVLMVAFLVLFVLTVKEPKLVEDKEEQEKLYGIVEDVVEDEKPSENGERMPKDVRRSFGFLLASIVLWFFAYNAATSKFSVYATNVLDQASYSLPLLVAQGAALIAFIPIGLISTKVGRKKTILIGVIILFAAFLSGCFITAETKGLMLLTMALAGIGWATINVNSFPMVVEMCKSGDVGRYTGYYYTASMAAQIATPIFSGMIMDAFGMRLLFPYCCIFAALAFLTMIFVRHGDSKPVPVSKLEMMAGGDDD